MLTSIWAFSRRYFTMLVCEYLQARCIIIYCIRRWWPKWVRQRGAYLVGWGAAFNNLQSKPLIFSLVIPWTLQQVKTARKVVQICKRKKYPYQEEEVNLASLEPSPDKVFGEIGRFLLEKQLPKLVCVVVCLKRKWFKAILQSVFELIYHSICWIYVAHAKQPTFLSWSQNSTPWFMIMAMKGRLSFLSENSAISERFLLNYKSQYTLRNLIQDSSPAPPPKLFSGLLSPFWKQDHQVCSVLRSTSPYQVARMINNWLIQEYLVCIIVKWLIINLFLQSAHLLDRKYLGVVFNKSMVSFLAKSLASDLNW